MDDSKTLQMILEKLDGLEQGQKELEEGQQQMQADIFELKGDVAGLKEDSTITRNAVNTLLDWAEKAQVQVRIPLFQKEK